MHQSQSARWQVVRADNPFLLPKHHDASPLSDHPLGSPAISRGLLLGGIDLPHDAKATQGVEVVWCVGRAVGAARDREVSEGSSANIGVSPRMSDGVRDRRPRIPRFVKPVLAPLRQVAMHVEQTEGVRLPAGDRVSKALGV